MYDVVEHGRVMRPSVRDDFKMKVRVNVAVLRSLPTDGPKGRADGSALTSAHAKVPSQMTIDRNTLTADGPASGGWRRATGMVHDDSMAGSAAHVTGCANAPVGNGLDASTGAAPWTVDVKTLVSVSTASS